MLNAKNAETIMLKFQDQDERISSLESNLKRALNALETVTSILATATKEGKL
jgi:hypothetical protein